MCGEGFDCRWGLLILLLVGNKVPSKNVQNEANGFYALDPREGEGVPYGMRRRRGNPIVNTFSLNKKERDDCILLVPSCVSPIFPPITLQHLLYTVHFGAWRKFWMRCGKRGTF